mmetsp:Transcript_29128/g.59679  ORF Transcript_29128/g.59679 Transcript_29128/m.59679 type:complete len:242 (-) Transcript_29128:190-915(-)|eukprot:CAMPEP_0181327586 /NCGR_PEP_ID=MMETSP1101-20121128/22193_1 /TAXON_ID=46948 /ORGANISM="Rhodomonas abbreviata, Strain Caron Lab Isolate" /LENGTH=241 /DNA_ID=CAMNT_0023436281 /DNA_START=56 /DNA_END=781 /DNA_ORIENTATION=-
MPDLDPDTISLRILRTNDARQFALAFPRSTLISTVARKVAEEENSQARVRLFYSGRALLADHDLRFYNIGNDDVIHALVVENVPDNAHSRDGRQEDASRSRGSVASGLGDRGLRLGLEMDELPQHFPFRLLPGIPIGMVWYQLLHAEEEALYFPLISVMGLILLSILYIQFIFPSSLFYRTMLASPPSSPNPHPRHVQDLQDPQNPEVSGGGDDSLGLMSGDASFAVAVASAAVFIGLLML